MAGRDIRATILSIFLDKKGFALYIIRVSSLKGGMIKGKVFILFLYLSAGITSFFYSGRIPFTVVKLKLRLFQRSKEFVEVT